MEYMTVRQAAEKWGVTPRQVQVFLKAGRIPGAVQPARDWLIPNDAIKPVDRRRTKNKEVDKVEI